MSRTQRIQQVALMGLGAGFAVAMLGSGSAHANLTIDIRLQAGEAPPPPSVVLRTEPEVILIPSSRVYYVPKLKFDLFRYGRYWYINNHGHWYRSRSYSGPFKTINNAKVPKSIFRVPKKYHRHPLSAPAALTPKAVTVGKSQVTPGQIGTKKTTVKKTEDGGSSKKTEKRKKD